jgi:glycosyltransferase involved in cell wall biosynthesis
MNVLFVHNNFPAQFRHVAAALSLDPQVNLAAIGSSRAATMPNVKLVTYPPLRADVRATHQFAKRFDVECRRADDVFAAASSRAEAGFQPDLVVAHPGWGEAIPLRSVFPDSRIIAYCEFFYGPKGRDVNFDPEFPAMGPREQVGLNLKNAATLCSLIEADEGLSPTPWQRSTFPAELRAKIKMLHEGVDVDVARPNPHATLRLANGREFTCRDEVVTFAARSLEPLRGIHVFLRAVPRILAARPNAQIVIIGDENRNPYGLQPPAGRSWKSIYLEEIAGQIDASRLHFVGHLAYHEFLSALQISSVHVYLTYPFVLSWSLIEAMSVGCLIVASDTAPVRDVINDENGILVPFFASDALAGRIVDALADPRRHAPLRRNTRRHVLQHLDMRRKCVPEFLAMLGRAPVAAWAAPSAAAAAVL